MTTPNLSQRQSQSQVQVLSQTQIQSLDILAMGGDDLRAAIYAEVQENPALVITGGAADEFARRRHRQPEQTRLAAASAAAVEESDRHQAALEACADTRRSLQDYLLSQLHVRDLQPHEMQLGERLIGNLDSRGFHILAPVSLLDKEREADDERVLEKVMAIIQRLDPPGCCCKDMEESLLVQAEQRPDAPLFALFLLDGHFDFLNPPKLPVIVRKARAFFEARSRLFALEDDADWDGMTIDDAAAEEALAFIRTLDPYPAREYSSDQTRYVAPDVYVEAVPKDDAADMKEDFSRGIVVQNGRVWRVRLANGSIPTIAVNPVYERYAAQYADKKTDAAISGGIKKAKEFISAVEGRQDTLLRGSCMIVKKQFEFFESGPGHLAAFRQKDVASVLGVHETTVSRMAGSKYLQCLWGLFPLKYFFVNAVGSDGPDGGGGASRDKVKTAIAQIIREYEAAVVEGASASERAFDLKRAASGQSAPARKKKLSDQKISDMLAERGMKVARRTVAKYRAELE